MLESQGADIVKWAIDAFAEEDHRGVDRTTDEGRRMVLVGGG